MLTIVYKVFGTTLMPTFCVLENFRRKFANLVAPPIDETAKCLVLCKVLQVLLTDYENSVQIDAHLATLSLFKIVKNDQNAVLNLSLCSSAN